MIMSLETETGKAKSRRPKCIKRFTSADIEAVTALMAKRHTEIGACALLGLNHKSWANWKSKAKRIAEFNDAFTRARAVQLNAHIENIEDASLGEGIHAKPDWRASDALIKLKFPELAPQTGQLAPQTNNLTVIAMHDTLKRLFQPQGEFNPPKAIECEAKPINELKSGIKMPTRRKPI